MKNIETNHEYRVDLEQSPLEIELARPLSHQDALADRFAVTLRRGMSPVDLTDAQVTGYLTFANTRQTLPIPGSVSGNIAGVTLTADCYAMPGPFTLAVQVVSGSVRHTVLRVKGTIERSAEEEVISSGELLPTLPELLEEIADMREATQDSLDAAEEARMAADECRTTIAEAMEMVNECAPPIVLESSGSVVSITEAAQRPIRSVVSTITAVQTGEGDPSPDNMRVITGWDTVQLFHGAAYDGAAEAALTAKLPETVFGGTLDWATGLLTIDKLMLTYDGTEDWERVTSSAGDTYFRIGSVQDARMSAIRTESSHSKYKFSCSHFLHVTYGMTNKPDHSAFMFVGGSGKTLAVIDASVEDADSWKAYLAAQAAAGTPLTCVFDRGTPRTIQLDPQTLTLLKGANALWSDCGDTAVTCVADTRLYIDNALAALMAATVQA